MKFEGTIVKADPDKGRVYGWGYVFAKDGAPVEDHSGDVIDTPEAVESLEEAFTKYVLDHRSGDLDHKHFDVSRLIEAVFVTKDKLAAMGAEGTTEGLWVGYEIDRTTEQGQAAWDLVKSGDRLAFSIVGVGRREEL